MKFDLLLSTEIVWIFWSPTACRNKKNASLWMTHDAKTEHLKEHLRPLQIESSSVEE